jgi:hypothetical protein
MMKRLLALMLGMTLLALAQTHPPRKVVLIVQNHAAPGAQISMMALTDALTAKLSGHGFQVVNPYNAVGNNQNRNAEGEQTPAVSALELARKLHAEGAITASVLEFLDMPLGNPPVLHQFSIRISLNLMDAGTGAAICGQTIKQKSPQYTNNQVAQGKQEYLGDLMYAAAEECAAQLDAHPAVKDWVPTPPPPPPPPVPPAPPKPVPVPTTILDRKVDVLLKSMLTSSPFVTNYDKCKAQQEGRLPLVALGSIKNSTGNPGLDALIKSAGERFRVKLFETKMFEVKDDSVYTELADRIIAGDNSVLEDGKVMEHLKQHGSPDFLVAGDLKLLTDLDGRSYYKFRLAIHSLATGKIIWEGIETFDLPAKQ